MDDFDRKQMESYYGPEFRNRRFTREKNQFERAKDADTLIRKNDTEAKFFAEQQQQLKRVQDANLDVLRKQNEFDQLNLEINRELLSVKKQQLASVEAEYRLESQRQERAKQEFGAMDIFGQWSILDILTKAEKKGFKSLTHDEMQELRRFGGTSELAAFQTREMMQDNPLFAQFDQLTRLLGPGGRRPLDDIARDMADRQRDVRQREFDIKLDTAKVEAAFAETVSQEFDRFATRLADSLTQAMFAAMRKFKAEELSKRLEADLQN